MAKVFAWMRPNDLIWNYWVNNYLLGNQPPAFDILYWNNDTTRLPAALHGEFVELFKSNPLNRPGALEAVSYTHLTARRRNASTSLPNSPTAPANW